MKQNKFNKDYYFGKVYKDYNTFNDYKWLAQDLIAHYRFRSFLDIGCGLGNLVKEIKQLLEKKYKKPGDVLGVDFSKFAVKQAKVPFIRLANCFCLPFSDRQFDLVYILGTFSYLKTTEDIKKAMQEAYRTSKYLIVFEDVYDAQNKLSDDDSDPHRELFLNQKQWLNLWKKVLNKKDKIRFNKEEIVIEKCSI